MGGGLFLAVEEKQCDGPEKKYLSLRYEVFSGLGKYSSDISHKSGQKPKSFNIGTGDRVAIQL